MTAITVKRTSLLFKLAKIREHFSWGSRGKLGDEPLHYIILKDMEDSHISAILETQTHIQDYIRKVFEDELKFRKAQIQSLG